MTATIWHASDIAVGTTGVVLLGNNLDPTSLRVGANTLTMQLGIGLNNTAVGTNTLTNNIFGTNNTAVGSNAAGGTSLGSTGAVAIGFQSGFNNQASNTIAIGTLSGKTNQGVQSIAIGLLAASTNQLTNSIAIVHKLDKLIKV